MGMTNKRRDFCIRGNKPTPYNQSTPITVRRYFVEGSGQLCEECWREVYGEPTVAISIENTENRKEI